MMNIRHIELIEESNKFLKENYNMKLEVPIIFNSRLKKVLGRLLFVRQNGKNKPIRIEFSIEFLKYHPKEHIIDVLKHELVHYALCILEKPYFDNDPYFENELKRLGINSTRHYKSLGDVHRYKCKDCGKLFERKRRLSDNACCNCSKNKSKNLIYQGRFNKALEVSCEGI